MQKPPRDHYNEALAALQEAYTACFNHPDRSVLGLSTGPFSGVNRALGVVATLEIELTDARRENALLKAERARLRRELSKAQVKRRTMTVRR